MPKTKNNVTAPSTKQTSHVIPKVTASEERLRGFIFIEVDFHKRLILLAKLANDKGFANLTRTSNQQRLFFVRVMKALQFLFNLSCNHLKASLPYFP